ncbi:hypothetical protein [Flavobacterium lacisediminis]|uniref:DUF5666 domain-containing protein n=1 Tax=Flavobacterium lacisediminis TaxID=2989705 RepID=A0ABT3EHD2_9FLAO|nr:hypothetical protein [Flavobacterium lacisediminis]MCW1147988.1 hypothetical protein [Flavobacterium lacisediminis]
MKLAILAVSFLMLTSFGTLEKVILDKTSNTEVFFGESFSLINDSKDKISIHTGTGFVSLNKGSKTSIGCNVGKEVRWANEGKKGDVIFKITADMCGKTLKLSELMK